MIQKQYISSLLGQQISISRCRFALIPDKKIWETRFNEIPVKSFSIYRRENHYSVRSSVSRSSWECYYMGIER